jgi:uncharacterized HAD superfamily protein
MSRAGYITLDIDGVFCDFTRDCFAPAGERVLGRALPHLHEESYDLREQLDITDAEHDRIWKSGELLEALAEAPVIERSLPLLNLLAGAEGFAFITARGHLGSPQAEPIRSITLEWVRRRLGIAEPDIYFVEPSEKAIIARMLGATEMWEDHPATVLQLADCGIPVLMPVYGYNRHAESHPLVHPVRWNRPIAALA